MDTTPVDLSHLFEQLGLESQPNAIAQYMAPHKLASQIHLTEATFWTQAQKSFLTEAL
ncbi:MAG: DUF2789 family protein [Shewanella sp.]|uniref:DUF2789 family protein n=1 Tax=Shewanella cutis TaxID=2766780 RepID=A0ABS9QTR8_9GAMM|nr:DUF2789 family protein [Shewanella sp. PS-2]MCG9963746.1 DUF2789 family protein [Shewanella sp. PS-2]